MLTYTWEAISIILSQKYALYEIQCDTAGISRQPNLSAIIIRRV